jgi:hypothetical protein
MLVAKSLLFAVVGGIGLGFLWWQVRFSVDDRWFVFWLRMALFISLVGSASAAYFGGASFGWLIAGKALGALIGWFAARQIYSWS